MEVGPFSLLSLVYYVATVHPWEWEALGQKISAWLRSPAPAAAPGL
jgi:hypothetical protein